MAWYRCRGIHTQLSTFLGEAQNEEAQITGQIAVPKVLYQDWSAPAIRLRFNEFQFNQAIDELKQKGQLQGLSLDYLPDACGTVMIWSRPLREMQQEIWRAIIG